MHHIKRCDFPNLSIALQSDTKEDFSKIFVEKHFMRCYF